MRIRIRAALLGLITAGSLGFGASQALATPAGDPFCDDGPTRFTSYCPGSQLVDCSGECAARQMYYGGWCHNNCCNCAI